jgi:two-component system response regulator NreC
MSHLASRAAALKYAAAMTRLVLLDDHRLFLDSFKVALAQEGSFTVVGDSTEASAAYAAIEAEKPDILITDLMLNETDGVAVARELTRRGLHTKVLILTMHSNRVFVGDAFDAGVRGYAIKEQPLPEIMEAIRMVASGTRYISPALGAIPEVLPEGSAHRRNADAFDRLSRREREIFCRIIDGLSSRDIARALSISIKTVETHRSHINRKLDVRSPSELIRVAALKGLLAGRGISSPEGVSE